MRSAICLSVIDSARADSTAVATSASDNARGRPPLCPLSKPHRPLSFQEWSGSRYALLHSGPLRTVHGSFDPHGSSLYEGTFRYPVSQLYFWRTTDFCGKWDGVVRDYSLSPIRLRFFSQCGGHPSGCPLR